jgi:hypothetical protein
MHVAPEEREMFAPDPYVLEMDEAISSANSEAWRWRRDYDRIKEWLERIGDGRLSIPFDKMDRTKAVPIAAWLADNFESAHEEWPEEREARVHAERERALRRAEELEREAAQLRARHNT